MDPVFSFQKNYLYTEDSIIVSKETNLNQFKQRIIDLEFLLKDTNVKKLYIYENFEIDNETIAIFAVENNPFGKSIVYHNSLGIFFVDQTTKQLINKYKDHYNWHGFMISRIFSRIFNLRGHLPIVNGAHIYLPLSGSKGRCPDWVGLHQLSGYQQKGNQAEFTTRDGEVFRMTFSGRNLRAIIHKACFISECHIELIRRNINSFAVIMLKPDRIGISQSFRDCRCQLHQNLRQIKKLAWDFWIEYFSIALKVTAEGFDPEPDRSVQLKLTQFNKKRRI